LLFKDIHLNNLIRFLKVIVLARVIADSDDENVTLTALAIMKIAELLTLNNTSLITQLGNK